MKTNTLRRQKDSLVFWPTFIFLGLIITLLIVFFVLAIPKNEIRLAVVASQMDADGKTPKSKKLQLLSKTLLQRGVSLIFVQQPLESEASNLEYLITKNEADIAFSSNTGATFTSEITDRFSSMGAIGRVGLFFLTKDSTLPIKKTRDLRGKKIILWSSPENKKRPAYTTDDFKASPYSSDYIVEQLFLKADINSKNTTITNTWPAKIKYKDEWNVWLAFANPGMINRESLSHAMYDEVMSGKVKFLVIDDLQGVSKQLPFLSHQTLPASTVSVAESVPSVDVPYLSTTMSVIVNNELDASLIYALADALRKTYSEESLLTSKNEFPNFDTQELFQPNEHALRYYKNETPFFINYLSPGAYTAATKLITLLLPLLTIFWPLMHLLPKAYKFYVKHKVTDWYQDLEKIEKDYPSASPEERAELEKRLDRVQDGLTRMRLPFMHLHYVQEIFSAKAHVDLIRRRIVAIKGKNDL